MKSGDAGRSCIVDSIFGGVVPNFYFWKGD